MNYIKPLALVLSIVFITTCLPRTQNQVNPAALLALLQANTDANTFEVKAVGIKQVEITFPKSKYTIDENFTLAVDAQSGNQTTTVTSSTKLTRDAEGKITNKAKVDLPTFAFGTTGNLVVRAGGSTESKKLSNKLLSDIIGYLKADKPNQYDLFGSSVAISRDGETIAVGVPGDDSNAVGVNSNSSSNSEKDSGAVYIFMKDKDTQKWKRQAYLKAENSKPGYQFGFSVALSDNGDTLVVGSPGEDNNVLRTDRVDGFTTGALTSPQTARIKNIVDSSFTDDAGAIDSGAAYLFKRTSGTWEKQFYIKASDQAAGDRFWSIC